MRGNTAPAEQNHAHLGSHNLQRINQFIAKRHQKEGEKKRKSQPAPHHRAGQRQHRALQQDQQGQMARKIDIEHRAAKPDRRSRCAPEQAWPPCCGGQRGQLRLALPDQPDDDRRQQQAMAVGGDIPPDIENLCAIPPEQREDDQHGASEQRQRGVPQGSVAINAGGQSGHSEAPAAAGSDMPRIGPNGASWLPQP